MFGFGAPPIPATPGGLIIRFIRLIIYNNNNNNN
jgi:hypothetical protein